MKADGEVSAQNSVSETVSESVSENSEDVQFFPFFEKKDTAEAKKSSKAQQKREEKLRLARESIRVKREQETKELLLGITPGMVQNAISGGIDYLKRHQQLDGSWEEQDIHVGGISALCTLALLNAGVTPDDPKMQKALEYLRTVDPTSGPLQSTYVTSLQTMVFCMAEPKKDAGLLRRNVSWLIQTQKNHGSKPGSWGYPYGEGDPSNSQFALLALYEAEQLGLEIPEEVWKSASNYWKMTQNVDGSWPYYYYPPEVGRRSPGSGSMTCAGIVSLIIAAEKSELADAQIVDGEFLPCQRRDTSLSKRISHGQTWMASHFSISRNPGNKDWHLYYLYGLERMGRMTEQRFIGGHDWYREGTAQLLRASTTLLKSDRQLVYWEGATSSERLRTIATPLALLFLSKGRYPVMMTKIQFTTETEDWNWHRHDLHYLARFVERKWKKHLTTQNVNLEEAEVEDLLLSPILFISGKDSPCPKDPLQRQSFGQKLRQFIDRGGFIVAEGVCPGGTFDEGFRQLLKEIFPDEEQHLYPMPPEHPIWSAETAIPPQFVRPIYCLDYGCRTCLLFLPGNQKVKPSLSCLWELAPESRTKAPHSEKVKQEIQAGLNLGLNILAYVTNREFQGKEERFALAASEEELAQVPEETLSARGKLAMANLRHGGGCEATPKALQNLLLEAQPLLGNPSGILEETIPISSTRLFEFPVVFMQGRYAFQLTPLEQKQLKAYLERGGLLLANSICGAKAFDEAFRKEFQKLFPGSKLEPIPLSDPLCTGEMGGFDLSKITIRTPQPERPSELQLWGLRQNGRWLVVYSPLDLSCALEKHPSAGCLGYAPEDAAQIGINVLLYSMQ